MSKAKTIERLRKAVEGLTEQNARLHQAITDAPGTFTSRGWADFGEAEFITGKVHLLKCEHCKDMFQHECEEAS